MIRQLKSKSFLFFFRDHLRSTLGITCGRGSFAVHFGDHLRSRDHLRLGIICGTVQDPSLEKAVVSADVVLRVLKIMVLNYSLCY